MRPAGVNFHIVVARIDHPQPRDAGVLVKLLLVDGVEPVIARVDDFRREPKLARGGGDEREVRAQKRAGGKFHQGPRRQQPRGRNVAETCEHRLVQARANALVPRAGRGAEESFAGEDFLVGVAHRSLSTLCRNRPVCERKSRATVSGVPSATMLPPASPPSGPRSITQSASAMRSRLCSMTITEWPASTSRCNTSTSRR